LPSRPNSYKPPLFRSVRCSDPTMVLPQPRPNTSARNLVRPNNNARTLALLRLPVGIWLVQLRMSLAQVPQPVQVAAWDLDELAARIPRQWRQLQGPIGTVCVAGDDRIGKSTLLTVWGRLLSRSEEFSFSVGQNRTSHTQGLWSAMIPAELSGLHHHINLCDSQGLKQVSEAEQWRLFSANVLIPSVVVYMLIDVVQNDQLRDLARMAQQFKQLSASEFARFGRTISPHLVVLVRDESDFESDGDGPDGDVTSYFEEALSGPVFSADKALIREIFKTREAWLIEELTVDTRRALRDGQPGPPVPSFERALRRVLASLDVRRKDFPQGGMQLAEWYGAVLHAVNSRDEGWMGRLIDHSEHLAGVRWWRNKFNAWGAAVLPPFSGICLLLGCLRCLGQRLDLAVSCAWLGLVRHSWLCWPPAIRPISVLALLLAARCTWLSMSMLFSFIGQLLRCACLALCGACRRRGELVADSSAESECTNHARCSSSPSSRSVLSSRRRATGRSPRRPLAAGRPGPGGASFRRSAGATRARLNHHLHALPGLTCQFGIQVVSQRGGVLSHLCFSEEWNELPHSEDEIFEWWLGEGKDRLRAAELLDPAKHEQRADGIPIFWASSQKVVGGALCFYIGHFKCLRFTREMNLDIKNKHRQALIELAFHTFDEELAGAIESIAGAA